ncbi:MAG: hypothetical protein ACI4V7_03245 [Succinivibrionaceae bacterium]
MSTIKKLGWVGVGFLATIGVCAYPASVYIGNKIYDERIAQLENTHKIKYSELETSFNHRKGIFTVTPTEDISFSFNVDTDFTLTGATSTIVPEYQKGTFLELLSMFPELSAPKETSVKVSYSTLTDRYDVDGSLGELSYNYGKGFCKLNNLYIKGNSPRTSKVSDDLEQIISKVKNDDYFFDLNIAVPNFECKSRGKDVVEIHDLQLSYRVYGFLNKFKPNTSNIFELFSTNIAKTQVDFKKLEFYNILFGVNSLKIKDFKHIQDLEFKNGNSYIVNNLTIGSFKPETFFIKSKDLDINNFNINSEFYVKDDDLNKVVNAYRASNYFSLNDYESDEYKDNFSEFGKNVKDVLLHFDVKKLSFKLNDGSLSFEGQSSAPMGFFWNLLSEKELNIDFLLKFDDKFKEAIDKIEPRAINGFIKDNIIVQKNNEYVVDFSFKNGDLIINDKKQ